MKHFRFLCSLAALFATSADAQSVQNVNAWFMYFGDHPVSDHWGVHLEAQVRRADAGLTWQQLLLRPALNYQVNKHLLLTGGYAYARSSPYGAAPGKTVFPEHRLYEQALIKHKLGKIPIQHRLRLEQRLVGIVPVVNADVDYWETRNRFRYMLRADHPLKGKWGIGVYDEVFLQFGGHQGARSFDQNRAYAALTYQLTPKNRLEVGYLHQYLAQRNGLITEHNHTLQFAWYSTTPFRKH